MESNGTAMVTVVTALGQLQALVMERFLCQAGIPAEAHGTAVQVPAQRCEEARALLHPMPRTGEIFCVA